MPDAGSDRELWWDHACRELLPRALMTATGCAAGPARGLGAEIAARGRTFARCGTASRNVLVAPFVEEAMALEPPEAPLSVRSAAVVVVRNALVDWERALGRLRPADLRSVLRMATQILLTFLATAPPAPEPGWLAGAYVGLPGRFPRAWGALAALFQALARGGGAVRYRVDYRPVAQPEAMPGRGLPHEGAAIPIERAPADVGLPAAPRPPDQANPGPAEQPALEPRVGGRLAAWLADAANGRDEVLAVPSLSWISRRHDLLLGVLERTLAQGGSVLTANYLLRPAAVYVRSGQFAVPAEHNHAAALADQRGLSDVHRACAAAALARLAAAS